MTNERLARALGSQYEVREMVGRGGFAEVWEVWDRELERRLAVKVIRPDETWSSTTLERFKQETRTVARLQHSNILPIHFVGEGEGLVYYAMPYVDGQSLADLLRSRGALPADHAVSIALPVLDALQHAHAAGLVHRDIKPDNIMLDRQSGRPMLVDFGIAKRLDAEAGLTQAGYVVGTPHYMSPEQALGEANLDARTDLYSFGAVLFQMVTGAPPFDGDSSQEIVGKHLAEPPPPASDVNARVPRWLSRVIERCLQKKPADRFQSVSMLIDTLKVGAAEGKAGKADLSSAETELVKSAERPKGRKKERRGVGRWVALVVVLLLVGYTGWSVTGPRLVVENELVLPVVVTVAGVEHHVAAEARARLALPRGGTNPITWTAVRQRTAEASPLGRELSGTISRTGRRTRVALTAVERERAWFAPLITNETDGPLSVTVNAGTSEVIDCGCTVPVGAVRMHIGYYPLFANSSVRVRNSQGRSAQFTDLGAEVNRRTGVVGLRFRTQDLR